MHGDFFRADGSDTARINCEEGKGGMALTVSLIFKIAAVGILVSTFGQGRACISNQLSRSCARAALDCPVYL